MIIASLAALLLLSGSRSSVIEPYRQNTYESVESISRDLDVHFKTRCMLHFVEAQVVFEVRCGATRSAGYLRLMAPVCHTLAYAKTIVSCGLNDGHASQRFSADHTNVAFSIYGDFRNLSVKIDLGTSAV